MVSVGGLIEAGSLKFMFFDSAWHSIVHNPPGLCKDVSSCYVESHFFSPPLLCPSFFFFFLFFLAGRICTAFLSITVLVLKVSAWGRGWRDGGERRECARGCDTKSFLPSLANICRRDRGAAARLFGATKQFNFGKISYPHLLAAVNCVLNSNAHARGKTKKRKKEKKKIPTCVIWPSSAHSKPYGGFAKAWIDFPSVLRFWGDVMKPIASISSHSYRCDKPTAIAF